MWDSWSAQLGRHLRELWRSPGMRRALLVLPLVVACGAFLLKDRAGSGGVALLGAGFTVLLVAGLCAALCGAWLVQDRRSGRREWLLTLAPSGGGGRLAAACGGWLGTLGLALAVGVLAGAAVTLVVPGQGVLTARPLRLAALEDPRGVWIRGPRGAGAAQPLQIALPPDARGVLELDVSPRFEGLPDIHRLDIAWGVGQASGQAQVGVRGPVRIPIQGAQPEVRVELLTPGLALRVDQLRLLQDSTSPTWALALCSLLLGLCAASIAPIAVFVSRATSAPTAAGVAGVLLLTGIVREPLLGLAQALGAQGATGATAEFVLRGVVGVAPPEPALEILADLGAARLPAGDLVTWMAPVLLYSLLGLLAVWLPLPRWVEAGR